MLSPRLISVAALAALALIAPAAAQAKSANIVVEKVTLNVAGKTFAPGATVKTTGGRVVNKGDATAPANFMSWYTSPSVHGKKTYLNGLVAVPALKPGKSSSYSMDLVLPSKPGKYYLGACWDQGRAYPAAHSTDSCAVHTKTFTIDYPRPTGPPAPTGLTTLTANPPSLDFGGTTAPRPVTITNTGARDSGTLDAFLIGGDFGSFTVTDNGCKGHVLKPGEKCLVTLSASPNKKGKQTLLTVRDDSDTRVSVAITG